MKGGGTELQLVSLIPKRFVFYDVFLGCFDLLKVTLKVLLRPWGSGSKQILIGFSNEILYGKSLAQTVPKLWAGKV